MPLLPRSCPHGRVAPRPLLRPARARSSALTRAGSWGYTRRSRCATGTTWPCSTRPGVAEVSLAIAADPSLCRPATPRGATPSPSSATAPPCSGSATSVRSGRCRSWRARRCSSSTSPASTPCRSSWRRGTVDELVEAIARIAPSFGGINLEDISAPRCFDIEEQLKERLDIPVFHDDQHGTAIVVLAGLLNAAKVLGRHPARPAGRRLRRRGGRRRRDPPAPAGRGARRRRLRLARHHLARRARTSPATRAGSPPRPTPACLAGAAGRGARGGRRVRRRLRWAGARGRDRRDGAARHGLRAREPRRPRCTPTSPAGTPPIVATGPLGLPEPDQQRAGLPRHLPWRARRRAPPRSPRR